MSTLKRTPYEDLMNNILENGFDHADRTGVGRRSIFGVSNRYDLSGGKIPVPTTNKIFTRGSIGELLYLFISGDQRITKIKDNAIKFWDRWAVKEENITEFVDELVLKARSQQSQDLTPEQLAEQEKQFREFMTAQLMNTTIDGIGPMYGFNWRHAPGDNKFTPFHPVVPFDEMPSDKLAKWEEHWQQMLAARLEGQEVPEAAKLEYFNQLYYNSVDQLNELLRNLKHRPHSSRLVVTAWIPQSVPFETLSPEKNVLIGKGALAACHVMFQCFVKPPKEEGGKKRLSLLMYQRSADVPVGVPHNMTQYAVLAHLLAHVTGMEADEFIHQIGDAHIYLNQIEDAKRQLERSAMEYPTITIDPSVTDLFQIKLGDIKVEGYDCPYEYIKYEIAK